MSQKPLARICFPNFLGWRGELGGAAWRQLTFANTQESHYEEQETN
jgi:hypothetical protein